MAEKKADKWKLYFIAIVVPTPYGDRAIAIKKHFSDQYNSKAALRSPPHITLHMPFEWKEEKEAVLLTRLQEFSITYSPVHISFNSFGCFPPRVIFIDIKRSEQLEILQKNLQRFCKQELNLFNVNYKELPFHPHVTVAFRDLKKTDFKKAWEEFVHKDFEGEFIARELSLLKHNGKSWDVFREFPFGSKIN